MYPNGPKVSFEPMPLPQVTVTPAWLPKIILKRLSNKGENVAMLYNVSLVILKIKT